MNIWRAATAELEKLANDANQLFQNTQRLSGMAQPVIPPKPVTPAAMGTTKIPAGTLPQHAGEWANHRLGLDQYDPANAGRQGKLESKVVNNYKASGALPNSFNLNQFKWHQENQPAPGRANPMQMAPPPKPPVMQQQIDANRMPKPGVV